uniref:Uncharacterized protein n=1 Tax=Plectus sambesii TaxID=2011161 RepID=A0A914V4M5_9BILA
MVHIWQMEPDPCGDRRLPHHVFPPKMLTPDQLQQKLGVFCLKLDIDDTLALKKRLYLVKQAHNCEREDTITFDGEHTCDFVAKMDELYEPVVRKTDIVNLVVAGSAYYDIEESEDEWIRVNVERGDLIVIPAGVTHRFTTTPKNAIQMRRFFASSPIDHPTAE